MAFVFVVARFVIFTIVIIVLVVFGSAFHIVSFTHHAFGHMTVKRYPVVDGLALLVVLVVDMTEPFFPCVQPFGLEFDNLFAESTPELALSVSSDPVSLA